VAAYRDAFVLFLDFAVVSLHKQPTTLSLQDITPGLILDFLAHLERDRGNCVRTPQCSVGSAARIPEIRQPP
jgi:hypothetical protein